MFYAEEGLGVAASSDGSNFGNADYTSGIQASPGESLQGQVTGENTFHVFAIGQGTTRLFGVEYGVDGKDSLKPFLVKSDEELDEESDGEAVISEGYALMLDLEKLAGIFFPPRPSAD